MSPRFDRAAFACGPQADVAVVRLPTAPRPSRSTDDAVREDRRRRRPRPAPCGLRQASRLLRRAAATGRRAARVAATPDGAGVAIVYLAACAAVPTAVVAAHELLHAFGALPAGGPPHACPDDRRDIRATRTATSCIRTPRGELAALVLDVGRDDYYAHSGTWLDVQDSRWLRLVTQAGPVGADDHGQWLGRERRARRRLLGDAARPSGTRARRSCSIALPAGGQRFVRWSGACTGADSCAVHARRGDAVTALFAPSAYRLTLSVGGEGSVRGRGRALQRPALRSQPPARTRRCGSSRRPARDGASRAGQAPVPPATRRVLACR